MASGRSGRSTNPALLSEDEVKRAHNAIACLGVEVLYTVN